uniref:Uncharacterized protein n=1 Tax=Chromera velia CCMP2878 TaxID=1169474 RepID=A0A0G4HTR1_9ALVE|eukprot:Cvel_8525.t1-p1 / transcript=Cvel_8525.t1 / gene=Cvel_8525 / organism=Chromera_velia_CCMP2878 / gene_product=hypothetical protein / transcript_product=hypothetical protein / location=Cvel_scaffold472:42335-45552(+) / protein_length=630 / sequence_SO=supercontig / SO=protein_coding / is_pseudo=false
MLYSAGTPRVPQQSAPPQGLHYVSIPGNPPHMLHPQQHLPHGLQVPPHRLFQDTQSQSHHAIASIQQAQMQQQKEKDKEGSVPNLNLQMSAPPGPSLPTASYGFGPRPATVLSGAGNDKQTETEINQQTEKEQQTLTGSFESRGTQIETAPAQQQGNASGPGAVQQLCGNRALGMAMRREERLLLETRRDLLEIMRKVHKEQQETRQEMGELRELVKKVVSAFPSAEARPASVPLPDHGGVSGHAPARQRQAASLRDKRAKEKEEKEKEKEKNKETSASVKAKKNAPVSSFSVAMREEKEKEKDKPTASAPLPSPSGNRLSKKKAKDPAKRSTGASAGVDRETENDHRPSPTQASVPPIQIDQQEEEGEVAEERALDNSTRSPLPPTGTEVKRAVPHSTATAPVTAGLPVSQITTAEGDEFSEQPPVVAVAPAATAAVGAGGSAPTTACAWKLPADSDDNRDTDKEDVTPQQQQKEKPKSMEKIQETAVVEKEKEKQTAAKVATPGSAKKEKTRHVGGDKESVRTKKLSSLASPRSQPGSAQQKDKDTSAHGHPAVPSLKTKGLLGGRTLGAHSSSIPRPSFTSRTSPPPGEREKSGSKRKPKTARGSGEEEKGGEKEKPGSSPASAIQV